MEWLRKKGRDLICRCPECGAPKLNWNPHKVNPHDDTKGMGVCNGCHTPYSRRKMERHFGPLQDGADAPTAPPRPPEPPPPDLVPWYGDVMGRMAVMDLRRWPVTLGSWGETCLYSPSQQRLYFRLTPSSGGERAPVVFTSRSIFPSQRGWHMTGPSSGYYYGKLYNWTDIAKYMHPSDSACISPLVLMEGIGDVLGAGLYGSAIAVLGTNLSPQLQYWIWQHGYSRVVVWLDPDEAGREAAPKWARELRGAFKVACIDHPVHPKHVDNVTACELINRAIYT